MDFNPRQKDYSQNEQYDSKEDFDTFNTNTTKKYQAKLKDIEIDQSQPTDRIYTQTQRSQQPLYDPYRQSTQFKHSDRTNSYQTTSQYQFLIYENKIHLLTDRLQCYMDEVQNLKKTNAILISKLSTIQNLDEQLQNQKLKNLQLREQLETYRDRIQDDKDQYESKINELKLKLEDKDKFIELLREENSKIIKKKDEQIAFFKEALKDKTGQLDNYEKQLHSIQIERLNTSQDYSSRDSLFTKNSAISQYNIRNSENHNTINLHQSTISVEEKARQFLKKNPDQLKIAMKSMCNAQKCLEIGGQQISTIMVDKENEKSLINLSRLSRSKVNKTYCK